MATRAPPPPSFVKQAMRNMVRKGSKSLFHFGLTAMGFLGFITLVAGWVDRPCPSEPWSLTWPWMPPALISVGTTQRSAGSHPLGQHVAHLAGSCARRCRSSCPVVVRRAEEISLGLRFTDDTVIRELNGTWRQRQEPTDVLSFAALEDAPDWLESSSVELGDIVISLDGPAPGPGAPAQPAEGTAVVGQSRAAAPAWLGSPR